MARYLIGIDLGTTNSALAYLDLTRPPRPDGRVELKAFPVPQLVAPGDVRDRPLLPSFVYLPGEHDLPPGSTVLPWDPDRKYVVGEFARNHGGKVPGRLVTSAKSWLCHAGVDRSAPLVPWSAPPDVQRLSPVEVSTRYLRHLVESWNHVMARDSAEHRIEKLPVVLTVPASFDDVARTLTMEAASKAGLENVVLLEEPQAAFYCWLATHPPAELNRLKPGSRAVVVDVGGGTTDFSLIEAVEDRGELGFIRQAVGEHLLLGGDNMDLALARFVEAKLPGGTGRLDASQYALLTQACRQAKETLMGKNPPAQQTVTVVGRGRSVIGGTVHAPITPADVHHVILDGFFPRVSAEETPNRGAKAGLHEMGLPYVSDPAITRHLSTFLRQQSAEATTGPDAILFNGGVFQAASLRERLLDVMKVWYDRPGAAWSPLVLTTPSLDLAVALGAAFYAWLRHTGGKRIGGGIPRSYYVALGGESEAAPASSPKSVLCVVPQHLEEGHEVSMAQPELELALGQPVVFPLFTSTVRPGDKPGDVLVVAGDQLAKLPPLHTVLRGGKRAGARHVPVTLAARLSAIGTMELFCVAREGTNRWKLEFNIREVVKEEVRGDEEEAPPQLAEVWLESQVEQAADAIRRVYLGASPPLSPAELPRALEAALESTRHEWPMSLCRRLWDYLAEVADARRSSPAHLSRWYNLVGHCLRPGFGDPLDRHRIEQLWKLTSSPPRGPGAAGAARPAEGGADFWVMWRRAAAGLNGSLQQALFDRLRGTLVPGKGRANAPRPPANELSEMWRTAASLERLDVRHKEAMGQALLKPLARSPVPPYAFWALTRLGARALVYGPLNAVVHHQIAESWIDEVLNFAPAAEGEMLAWAFCLSQLARKTGQRALDVSDEHRDRVLAILRSLEVPEHWAQMVAEVTELQGDEQGQMLGDSLPIGLRLVRSGESAEG